MFDSNILVKVEEIVGEMPTSRQHAVHLLHSYLSDLDQQEYVDIDDIDILIEISSIFNNTHIAIEDNPWKRNGKLIEIDEWHSLPDFRKLRAVAEEVGWETKRRKCYYSFIINKRIFFKIEAVRNCSDNKNSGRIIIPRVDDIKHLEIILDTYNLVQFRDRQWKVFKDKKLGDSDAHGRYFFLEELETFVKEISKRI